MPLISTSTESINELLPKATGLTVPDKSAIQLAQKIESIYNNPEEHQRLSRLSRKIIENDWDVNLTARKMMARFAD